jgi:putative chitinase
MSYINVIKQNNFVSTMVKYGITTPLRLKHFFAQMAHESGNFTRLEENLNYSASGLMTTFKNYFPTLAIANAYARQPEKIANRVYANRNGNGNEASGDGWKYRGRGIVHLTGRYNYQHYKNYSGIDVVNNPDLAKNLAVALDVAGWFWTEKKLNDLADKNNITAITQAINGGTNGLKDRIDKLNIFSKINLLSFLTQKKK